MLRKFWRPHMSSPSFKYSLIAPIPSVEPRPWSQLSSPWLSSPLSDLLHRRLEWLGHLLEIEVFRAGDIWAGCVNNTLTDRLYLFNSVLISILSQVESRTSIPIITILFTTILAVLLDLIELGSGTVLNIIISLAVTAFYSSYLLSAALLLWRRCTGGITTRNSDTNPSELVWGPWRVPGVFGVINNAYACVWMVIVLFFTSWPPETPVSATTMNYSIFITLGVSLISTVYYLVWGKHNYKGPVVETTLPESGIGLRMV